LEACTALLPPEAAELAAQQGAVVAVALRPVVAVALEPVVQQEAAVAAEPVAPATTAACERLEPVRDQWSVPTFGTPCAA
jgi:hypothetical protein